MHRIDTPTAEKDKFGAGKNGFRAGNPQTGTVPTSLDNVYWDSIQEEICGVVESANIVLDKSKRDQLAIAINRIISSEITGIGLKSAAKRDVGNVANQIPDMSYFASGNNWSKLPNGTIMQWGIAVSGPVGIPTFINFPVAFTNYNTIQVIAGYDAAVAGSSAVVSFATAPANTGLGFSLMGSQPNGSATTYARWIAIGK